MTERIEEETITEGSFPWEKAVLLSTSKAKMEALRTLPIFQRHSLEAVGSGVFEPGTWQFEATLTKALYFLEINPRAVGLVGIAADTIVELAGRELGKPKDLNEAKKWIDQMSRADQFKVKTEVIFLDTTYRIGLVRGVETRLEIDLFPQGYPEKYWGEVASCAGATKLDILFPHLRSIDGRKPESFDETQSKVCLQAFSGMPTLIIPEGLKDLAEYRAEHELNLDSLIGQASHAIRWMVQKHPDLFSAKFHDFAKKKIDTFSPLDWAALLDVFLEKERKGLSGLWGAVEGYEREGLGIDEFFFIGAAGTRVYDFNYYYDRLLPLVVDFIKRRAMEQSSLSVDAFDQQFDGAREECQREIEEWGIYSSKSELGVGYYPMLLVGCSFPERPRKWINPALLRLDEKGRLKETRFDLNIGELRGFPADYERLTAKRLVKLGSKM